MEEVGVLAMIHGSVGVGFGREYVNSILSSGSLSVAIFLGIKVEGCPLSFDGLLFFV